MATGITDGDPTADGILASPWWLPIREVFDDGSLTSLFDGQA